MAKIVALSCENINNGKTKNTHFSTQTIVMATFKFRGYKTHSKVTFLRILYESENHKKWHFKFKSGQKSYVFYLSLCVSSTRPQNTNNSRSMFPSVAIYICAKFLNKSTKWHFYIGCVFVWHIFCAPVVSFTRYGQVQVVFIK